MSQRDQKAEERRLKECFAILDMEITKDSEQIRKMYHKLLVMVNPEDDPEGFKRLRTAYEEAIAYAQTPAENTEEEKGISRFKLDEDSLTGRFMTKFEQIYSSVSRRIDLKEWEALLSDPVITSLDEGEKVKWQLFETLSEKYFLPASVFRILDRVFLIRENRKEFEEHLPPAFVNYMVKKAEDEEGISDFWYEALEGADGADFDGFIREQSDYLNQLADHKLADIKKRREKLEHLSLYGVDHPFLELEKAKLWLHEGKNEQALDKFRELVLAYPDNDTIQTHGAEGLYRSGCPKEAQRIYDALLNKEKLGSGYRCMALLGMAKIKADCEEWKEAGSFALEARTIGTSEPLTQFLERVLPKAIEEYEKNADHLTTEEVKKLGKSYVHLKRGSEGLAFFEAHPEYCLHSAWWYKLSAALHYLNREYEAVLTETANWRECLKTEDTEIEKQRKEIYEIEGAAWSNLYFNCRKEAEDGGKSYLENAVECLDHAIETEPENMNYYMNKVMLYREAKDYGSMADVCEKLKEMNPEFYWAYFYLQEAYEGLHMAQKVIDTFYQARRLYNKNPEIYERAAEVFFRYRQYEDAGNILKLAKEANVESFKLMVQSLKVEEVLAKTQAEWKTAEKHAKDIIRRMKREKAPKELLAEAFMARYFLNENENRSGSSTSDAALRYILASERLVDDVTKLYYIGRLYLICKKDDKKAYRYLKLCEDRKMNFEWVYIYLGQIMKSAKKWEEELAYYQKILEVNPKSSNAYWRIGWFYMCKFQRTGQPEYGKKSLEYLQLQDDKVEEEAFNHWRKARILYFMRESEAALEEVEKSFAPDGNSGQWKLKGDILYSTQQFDPAIDNYLNSIRCKRRYNEDNTYVIDKISRCFVLKKDYEGCRKCLETLAEELKKEDEVKKCHEILAYLEADQGHIEKAFSWLEKEYESLDVTKKHYQNLADEAERIEIIYKIWQRFLPVEEAVGIVGQYADKTAKWVLPEIDNEEEDLEDRLNLLDNLADIYFYMGDYDKAVCYYEKLYEMTKRMRNYDGAESLAYSLMFSYYFSGCKEKAKTAAGRYRKYYEKPYKECTDLDFTVEELILRSCDDAKNKLYQMFLYSYFSGRMKQAYYYKDKMMQSCMCYYCGSYECAEMKEVMAMLSIAEGDYKKAAAFCKESNGCTDFGNNRTAQQLLLIINKLSKDDRRI